MSLLVPPNTALGPTAAPRQHLERRYRRTGDQPKAEEHVAIATTMYREMDVGFWLEQAEAVLSSSTAPSGGPSRPLPHVEDVKAPPRQVEVEAAH
jgi:hypothetical protein